MNDQDISTQKAIDYAEYEELGRIWGEVPPSRIKKIKFDRVPTNIRDAYLDLVDLPRTRHCLIVLQARGGEV